MNEPHLVNAVCSERVVMTLWRGDGILVIMVQQAHIMSYMSTISFPERGQNRPDLSSATCSPWTRVLLRWLELSL